MSVEEQIKILCVKKDISLSELARLNNISPQNFSQKLKRNTLTVDDLKAIADKLECTYQTSFVLPNGEKVEYQKERYKMNYTVNLLWDSEADV